MQHKHVDNILLSSDCNICRESFKEDEDYTILPCSHYYHSICISRWFESKSTCPECRTDLTEHITKEWTCEFCAVLNKGKLVFCDFCGKVNL